MATARFAAPFRSRSNSSAPSLSRRRAARIIAGCASLAALGLIGCERAPEPPRKGAPFPAFALPAPDGVMHHSGEYFGQPLLINFWATWCPPCRAEMAALDACARTLAPRGLRVVAISVDSDRNLLIEYLRRTRLGLTVLIDFDQQWSASQVQVPGFPTSYLIGGDGLIRAVWVGARAWDEARVQEQLAALVGLR